MRAENLTYTSADSRFDGQTPCSRQPTMAELISQYHVLDRQLVGLLESDDWVMVRKADNELSAALEAIISANAVMTSEEELQFEFLFGILFPQHDRSPLEEKLCRKIGEIAFSRR